MRDAPYETPLALALFVALGLVLATLTAHRETELRHATNADSYDHDRPQERRDQERDGQRHSTAFREEVNAYVRGVLRNEINERYAKDNGDDHTDPRGRNPRVAKVLTTVSRALAIVAPLVLAGGSGRRSLRIVIGLQVFAVAHAYLGLSQNVVQSREVFLARLG